MSEISETAAATADFDVRWLDGGAVFTVTRPRKMNAITKAVLEGLSACLDELEAGRGRFLVIAGEGEKAFSAGTDLAEAAGMAEAPLKAKTEFAQALLYRLSRSRVLSVAAMNGSAYGGGLEFAMACTFRVAAPHIVMSMPEIKLGLLPSYGGTQFLPAIVGKAHALDLMLTGRTISAPEALAIGLVNRIAQTPASALTSAVTLVEYWVNRMVGFSLSTDGMQALTSDASIAAIPALAKNAKTNPATLESAYRRLVGLIAQAPEFIYR